jgi:hypothetical protein
MPIIEVRLYDKRVAEETVRKIIDSLTTALVESSCKASARSTGGSRGRCRGSAVTCLRESVTAHRPCWPGSAEVDSDLPGDA